MDNAVHDEELFGIASGHRELVHLDHWPRPLPYHVTSRSLSLGTSIYLARNWHHSMIQSPGPSSPADVAVNVSKTGEKKTSLHSHCSQRTSCWQGHPAWQTSWRWTPAEQVGECQHGQLRCVCVCVWGGGGVGREGECAQTINKTSP